MANPKGNQANLKSWAPGVSGNPKGRPPSSIPGLQAEIERNRNDLKVLILKYLNASESEIRALESKDIPIRERIVIQCFLRIIMGGDVSKLKALLEIPFGKQPESQPFDLESQEQIEIST